MTIKQLREHLEMRPFHPIVVRTVSGTRHSVKHPDYLFIPPVGDTFLIVEPSGARNAGKSGGRNADTPIARAKTPTMATIRSTSFPPLPPPCGMIRMVTRLPGSGYVFSHSADKIGTLQ